MLVKLVLCRCLNVQVELSTLSLRKILLEVRNHRVRSKALSNIPSQHISQIELYLDRNFLNLHWQLAQLGCTWGLEVEEGLKDVEDLDTGLHGVRWVLGRLDLVAYFEGESEAFGCIHLGEVPTEELLV